MLVLAVIQLAGLADVQEIATALGLATADAAVLCDELAAAGMIAESVEH